MHDGEILLFQEGDHFLGEAIIEDLHHEDLIVHLQDIDAEVHQLIKDHVHHPVERDLLPQVEVLVQKEEEAPAIIAEVGAEVRVVVELQVEVQVPAEVVVLVDKISTLSPMEKNHLYSSFFFSSFFFLNYN